MEEPPKKKHRAPRSGSKAVKKTKIEGNGTTNPKGFSVQHATKVARKVRKTLDRETKKYHLPNTTATVSVESSPPLMVGIVGPPRSGKTTLLRSLIKHFGRQVVPVITGPITVVVGKKYRMTFIECDCNINSMIDVAKVTDLILLVVNVHKGLEMYHFEFINMLQVHGMPRVIPVLNHLDQFKESSASRALRKRIKSRLWTDLSSKIFLLSRFLQKKAYHRRSQENGEVDGEYMPAEIQRLARLMVVKSPRPSDWRTAHPYMLVDRLEDVTNPRVLEEDKNASRTISMYGWVRGAPIEASANAMVHIPGLGDFQIAEVTRQQDPCPTPAQLMQTCASTEEAIEAKLKKRLSEGERKLYAPMSSIGGVLFDRDATYIDLGGSHHLGGGRLTSGRQVVGAGEVDLAKARDLLSTSGLGLDERLENDHRVKMLADAPLLEPTSLSGVDLSDNSYYDSDEGEDLDISEDEEDPRMFADIVLPEPINGNSSGSSNDEDFVMAKAKPGFDIRHKELKDAFDNLNWDETSSGRPNWKHIVYSAEDESTSNGVEDSSVSITGEMFRVSTTFADGSGSTSSQADDVTLPQNSNSVSRDWSAESAVALIANRFTTGDWNASEDAEQLLKADADAQRVLQALKAQKIAKAAGSSVRYKPQEGGSGDDEGSLEEENMEHFDSFDEDNDDASGGSRISGGNEDETKDDDPTKEFEKSLLRPTKRERILEKRRRHKELFDRLYDSAQRGSGTNADEPATAFYDKLLAKQEAQQQLNREVLDTLPPGIRETVEGVPPGCYVRIQIEDVPHQFIENFDPRQPLVVGGLVKGEQAKSFIQARFQAHRWLRRVLKSNDPITVSVGWRRYQTIGVFSKEEHNFRKRFLKYALAHEHCHVTFYGPVVPAKTGVVAFVNSTWREQTESTTTPKFRIAGTGSVTDCNESLQIMKKLKLVGYPYKIFSKTAFIRGMFNSELEVAKMIGCKIQTVSKVRGLIKSTLTGSSFKPGDFRATFEANIRKADIVFARTFVPIELTPFFNPIPNLLMPTTRTAKESNDIAKWRMLRTAGEIRKDSGIKLELKADSSYKPPERVPFTPTPLIVPTKLVAALPFADKPKMNKKQLRTQRFLEDEVRKARREGIPGQVRPRTAALEGGGEDIPNPVGHLRDRAQLLQHLREIHASYQAKEHSKMVARTAQFKAKLEAATREAMLKNKQKRKEFFARSRGGSVKRSGGRDL